MPQAKHEVMATITSVSGRQGLWLTTDRRRKNISGLGLTLVTELIDAVNDTGWPHETEQQPQPSRLTEEERTILAHYRGDCHDGTACPTCKAMSSNGDAIARAQAAERQACDERDAADRALASAERALEAAARSVNTLRGNLRAEVESHKQSRRRMYEYRNERDAAQQALTEARGRLDEVITGEPVVEDDPFLCPTCGAKGVEFCTNPSTGAPKLTGHKDRRRCHGCTSRTADHYIGCPEDKPQPRTYNGGRCSECHRQVTYGGAELIYHDSWHSSACSWHPSNRH